MSNHFRSMFIFLMMAVAFTSMGAGKKDDKAREPDAALFLAPLNDSLNIDAGTLETRFSLDYSFDEYLRPEASNCSPFFFLQIYNKDGSPHGKNEKDPVVCILMHQGTGIHRFFFGNADYFLETKAPSPAKHKGFSFPGSKEAGTWISQGEWHSLAVTWKVEKEALHVEMFLDGKLRNHYAFTTKDTGIRPLSKDDLLGIGDLGLSPATILSYRLSNRVRTKEEIASEDPLKPDEATTFFLDGETAAKFGSFDRKDFEKMSKKGKMDLKKNGAFFGKFKIVDTPKGKAVQFYDKLSR